MNNDKIVLVSDNSDQKSSISKEEVIDKILLDSGVFDKDLLQIIKKMELHDNGIGSSTVYEIAEHLIESSIRSWQNKAYDTKFKDALKSGNEVETRRQIKEFYKSPTKFIEDVSQEEYDEYLEFLKGKGIEYGNASTISLNKEGVIELVYESPDLTRRFFMKPTDKDNIKVSMQELGTVCDINKFMTDNPNNSSNVERRNGINYIKNGDMILHDVPHILSRMIFDREGNLIRGDRVEYWSYGGIPDDVRKYNQDSHEWEAADNSNKETVKTEETLFQKGTQIVNNLFGRNKHKTSQQLLREYREERVQGYEILDKKESLFQRAISGIKRATGGETYKSKELQSLLEYRRKKGKDYVESFVSSKNDKSNIDYPDL